MNSSNSIRRKLSRIAAVCALGFAALGAYSESASADEASAMSHVIRTRVDALHARDLEKAFWICDHIAATQGVDAAPVELCSIVYETLRDQRFGGDFNELLAWWQQNKHIEHAALASSGQ